MKQHLLLLEDIDGLGRSGDIVTAKPGFIRNYLLPKKKAVLAGPATLRMQERLKKQRAEQALVDKKASEAIAESLKDLVFTTRVKVDAEGHMYGSVGAAELVRICEEQGIILDRKSFVLSVPLKKLGKHTVSLKLKEGVTASCTVRILSEDAIDEEELPQEPVA